MSLTGNPPTREELLHLVNRAERGVLTPGEADMLRAGVLGLLDAVGGRGVCLVCGAQRAGAQR